MELVSMNPIEFGTSAIDKAMANYKGTISLTQQMAGQGGTANAAQTGTANQQQGIFANAQNTGGDASGKVSQATQMAYSWLDAKQSSTQNTGLASQAGQVNKAVAQKRPPVVVRDLGEGTNAQTNGSSVTINQRYAEKSSVGSIAASILHEFNHIAFGGGDKADETRAESFAEMFRDDNGIGKFNSQQDVTAWTNKNYSNLAEDGVNFFA